MKCEVCNTEITEKDNYCNSCGAKLVDEVMVAPVTKTPNTIIILSAVSVVVAFIIGQVLPIFIGILCLLLLGVILKQYFVDKDKSIKSKWALALVSLAVLFSIFYTTIDLIKLDYANKSLERINEELNLDLEEVKPVYRYIGSMDGMENIIYDNYSINELIYKYDEEKANTFLTRLNNDQRFLLKDVSILKYKFKNLSFLEHDYVLVYDRLTSEYQLPEDYEKADLIIIIYNTEDRIMQILEIKR